MEKIIWDEQFSVDIPIIDQQHQRLVRMINDLITAESIGGQSERVSDILNRMTTYAEEHFATEEKIMQARGYPLYSVHHQEHMAFIRKIVNFATTNTSDKESVSAEMLTFLKDWLATHILNSDMQYKDFFEQE
jgi:hemerythrin